MKKIYPISLFALACLSPLQEIKSQCATTTTLGSASNMLTIIRNATNPIAADKNLNTIIYAHRNNATGFGGSSGTLRYDVSTNGGTSWSNDQGLLNPLQTSPARYPNALIYNPAGNVTPNNAFLGYLAATTNTVANVWNGQVNGVRQVSGAGNTENYNQMGGAGALIPNSVVKGAPGVFWACDAIWNGTLVTGFKIYKGTWNGTNDIVWAVNYTNTPSFNVAYDGTLHVSDYNIAFDPTGNTGYMSFLGHLTGGPSNYAYYPCFYKTVDGGVTWTGPVQVDINQFSCITGNLTGTNVATCNFEHDLTVDVNGNPHFFTTICNGNNGYSVYYGYWHHMFDITSLNGVWNAYDIGNVNAGRGTWGVNPNQVSMDMAPQIGRTADGTKIFYAWSDNATYTLGAANQTPNLFTRGFNVSTFKCTNIKDFTSCNGAVNGLVYFPHISAEVLEPTVSTQKLPFVYGEFTVPNDPISVCNFRFLDNCTYANTEFSVSIPMATVTIAQGSNWLLCPGSTATLNITGVYSQVLWNNGGITNTITVNTPSTYIATARNGCTLGADTIVVTGLTTTLTPASPSICVGASTTLNIAGNAFGYTWTPGPVVSNSIAVTPTATSVYTVTSSGNSCTYPQTVSVVVNPLPTLTVTGSPSVCIGSSVTQTVSGANTYSWSNGANTATVSLSPTVNATYSVVGTNSNNCVNSTTLSITVNALPTLSVSGTNTLCAGNSSTLTASGAATYTWSNGPTVFTTVVTPSATANYTVMGTSANTCTNSAVYAVTVNALPTLSVSSSSSVICTGSAATLTASGASSYSWSIPSNSIVVVVSPTVTSSYTLSGTGANTCSNTMVFTQSVSACTGLMELAGGEQISIYPNPNTGRFSVFSEFPMKLNITDQLGRIVLSFELYPQSQTIVDVSFLAKGVYFVSSEGNGTEIRKKIIIQ